MPPCHIFELPQEKTVAHWHPCHQQRTSSLNFWAKSPHYHLPLLFSVSQYSDLDILCIPSDLKILLHHKFIYVCHFSKFLYVCHLSKFIYVCHFPNLYMSEICIFYPSHHILAHISLWCENLIISDQVPILWTAWRWWMQRGGWTRRRDWKLLEPVQRGKWSARQGWREGCAEVNQFLHNCASVP